MKYTTFFHNINANALRMTKFMHQESSFDELMNLVERNHLLSCDPDANGCGKLNYIHHLSINSTTCFRDSNRLEEYLDKNSAEDTPGGSSSRDKSITEKKNHEDFDDIPELEWAQKTAGGSTREKEKIHHQGVNNDIFVEDVQGDVFLEGVTGDVTVEFVVGQVSVVAVKGLVDVLNVNGGISVEAVKGDVYIDGVVGNITVKCISGEVKVENVMGDINLGSVAGNVEVNTVLGNLFIEGVAGDVDMDDVRYDVKVEMVKGEADISKVGGDATLQAVKGQAIVKEVRGTTKLDKHVIKNEVPATEDPSRSTSIKQKLEEILGKGFEILISRTRKSKK
nr:Peptidase C19, ubiquitin carboxyl-terminal hydrolase 2 [Ipomoea batatas]